MLENPLLKKPTEKCTKSTFFRLFFLKNNENYGVEVEEFEEIDFTKIIERLKRGESVFISLKCKQESSRKIPVKKFSKENASEPWYFTHI
ncbi:MAG: hypothetical protein QXL10_06170 [Candidatus Bathyarchaeia archaeon]